MSGRTPPNPQVSGVYSSNVKSYVFHCHTRIILKKQVNARATIHLFEPMSLT